VLAAADPGGNRFLSATGAVAATGTALGAEVVYGHLLGLDARHRIVVVMLGAVVAMVGSTAMAGSRLEKLKLAALFPVAAGIGIVSGVAVSPHQDLMLVGFVIVMFVAVIVRRFGLAFFSYGMLLWVGYFLAAFVKAQTSQLPQLLGAAVVASAVLLLLFVTVLAIDPANSLDRMLRAYGARARASLRAAALLLDDATAGPVPDDDLADWRADQRRRTARLAEAALMIEAWSVDPAALPPGRSAAGLRRELMDAQQVLDEILHAADALAGAGGPPAGAAAAMVDRLADRDHREAERLARVLLARTGTGALAERAARRLASAVLEYVALARAVAAGFPEDAPGDEPAEAYAPAATMIFGSLTGSPAVAAGVRPRGRSWNPLTRLDLVGRQAVQSATAGAIAIVAGRMLDPTRYYWAAIAAFIVFSGTATRAETSIKAFHRIAGTLVGLLAAIWCAHLTGGRTYPVIAVVLACLWFGFYLIKVSYAYLIFFVTVMVGQMYVMLGTFSDHLLVLRLEETLLGGTIGIVVALVVAPLSTRDTARAAEENLLTAVADFLDAAGSGGSVDAEARVVENRMHQLTVVYAPLTRPLLPGHSPRGGRHRLDLFAALTTHVRALAAARRRGPLTGALPRVAGPLAAAARALAQPDLRAGQAAARAHVASVDATLFDCYAAAAAVPSGEFGRVRAERALTHLMLLFGELAGAPHPPPAVAAEPGGTPAGAVVLTGVVRDGSGVGVGGAEVLLTDSGGRHVARSITSPDGRYALAAHQAGSFLAIVSDAGRAMTATPVLLEAGTTLLDLRLRTARKVTGHVFAGAEPAGGAVLSLLDSSGHVLASTQADPNGRYVLHDLPPGVHTLVAALLPEARAAARLLDDTQREADIAI
jgi:hypothetical protein